MKIHIGPYSKNDKPRKVDIRIDKYDTWSMDHTLALIIHPMLIQLKATKHGAPGVDDEDVPEELRSSNAEPKKEEWDTDSLFFKRWDWVLDEMIWVFGELLDDEADDKFHTGKHEIMFKPVEHGDKKKTFVEMYEGPNSTYVFDKEGYTAWNKRKQNAFILFGKYYQSLWD
jgi:hypothetical protein